MASLYIRLALARTQSVSEIDSLASCCKVLSEEHLSQAFKAYFLFKDF